MSVSTGRGGPARQLQVELHDALSYHKEDLTRGLFEVASDRQRPGLWGQGTSKYHWRRAAGLVDNLLGAVLEGPEAFIAQFRRLEASQGGAASGTLDLWGALAVLEHAVWRIVVQEVRREHQLTLVGWVTRTFGAAKDQLLCTVIAQLDEARAQAGALEQRLAHLTGEDFPVLGCREPGDAVFR